MYISIVIIGQNLEQIIFLLGTCPSKPRPEDCTTYKRKQCTTTSQILCSNKGKRKKRQTEISAKKNTTGGGDILLRKKRTIDVALELGKKLWNTKLNIIKGIFGKGKNKNKKPPSIVRPPSPPSSSNNYPSSSHPSSGYPSSSFPSSNYPSALYPSNQHPSYPSSSSHNCYKVPKRTCKWVPYKRVCKKKENCKPKPTTECKKECKNVYNCYDCPDKKPTPVR